MRINILSAEVYNKIAAGEVVERPASALKEIVENSIDAGATRISISVEKGGMGLISVSDNGCGIYEEDLDAVFLKHATSKISSISDMEALSTLGFRGEALSSIAAVSRVVLTTRVPIAESGVRISVEDGVIKSKEYVSTNVGTKIDIYDLFYNVPARKKFLKSQSGEATEITKYVSRLILTNPNLHMDYTLDGKSIFQTNGNGLAESILVIYGDKTLDEMLPVSYDRNLIRVSGYISLPSFIKSNTTYQILSVNGRLIEDKGIQGAIAQAYKKYYVGNGRHYPMYVLNIELPCDMVDVNVHPRKSEVRFQKNTLVVGALFSAVHICLDDYMSAGFKEIFTAADRMDYVEDPYDTIEIGERPSYPPNNELFKNADEMTNKQIEDILEIERRTKLQSKPSLEEFKEATEKVITVKNARIAGGLDNADGVEQESVYLTLQPTDPSEEPPERDIGREIFARTRILGTAFKTYLMLELDDKLILVDQHAAHERILFDKFMQNRPKTMQYVMFPYVFNVKADEAEFISNNLDNFLNAGIEVQPFGENTFRINSISTLFGDADMQMLVSYILSSIEDFAVDDQELIVQTLAKKACKAAVKAGETLSRQEIEYLLKMMYENEVVCCPHGRPVTVVFKKSKLDKMFKRT